MARTRTCGSCAEDFPLTEDFFPRSSQNKSGFESTCKVCRYGKGGRLELHQKHVCRFHGEPRPPKQSPCKVCGSLPWRVEGDKCVECGLKAGEEKAVGLAYCQSFHVNGTVFPDMSEVA